MSVFLEKLPSNCPFPVLLAYCSGEERSRELTDQVHRLSDASFFSFDELSAEFLEQLYPAVFEDFLHSAGKGLQKDLREKFLGGKLDSQINVNFCPKRRYLIVAGSPYPSSPKLLQELGAQADVIIAADHGADACYAAELVPTLFCGDGDSRSHETARWLKDHEVSCIQFPPKKYLTDLKLALELVQQDARRHRARASITLTCASGGRSDHALVVIGNLKEALSWAEEVSLIEDASSMYFLSAKNKAIWQSRPEDEGKTCSIVALTDEVPISISGMYWPLDRYLFRGLDESGLSNIITAPQAQVCCHKGVAVVVVIES